MPNCPFCGELIQLGRRTCPYCQASLAMPCPHCGFMLPGLLRVCPKCRQRVDDVQPQVAAQPEPEPVRPADYGLRPAARASERDTVARPQRRRARSWEDILRGEVDEEQRAEDATEFPRTEPLVPARRVAEPDTSHGDVQEPPEVDERAGEPEVRRVEPTADSEAMDDEPATETTEAASGQDEAPPARPASRRRAEAGGARARKVRTWADLGDGGGDDEPEEPRARRRPSRRRVRSWADLKDDSAPEQAHDDELTVEDAPPSRRRSWEDDEDETPRTRRRRSWEDDEDDVAAKARPRSEDDEPGDEKLTALVHDDLHDMVFVGLKGALELRAEATDFMALMEALDPKLVEEEIEENAGRLGRLTAKVLRRHHGEGVDLDSDALQAELRPILRSMRGPWDDLDDALRGMRRGAIIPEEEAQEYYAAVMASLKGVSMSGTRFKSMLGRPIEGFRPGKAGTRNPRRMLGNYHKALAEALEATDKAWAEMFDVVVARLRDAGGPKLVGGSKLQDKGEEVEHLRTKALELMEVGEARKALKVIDKARRAAPYDLNVAVAGLEIARKAKNKDEIQRFAEILERDFQDSPESMAARAELAVARGDLKDAAALYENALAAQPNNRGWRQRLVEIYSKLKEHKKVLKHGEPLAEDFPKNPDYQLMVAEAHGYLDHEEEALEYLERYVELVEITEELANKLRQDEAFDCLAANDRFDDLLEIDLDLLALADSIFRADNKTFYFGDEVPPRKLRNAQKAWLHMGDDETLVFLIDTTFMGRCTDGVAVTDERIYWKDMGCDPESYRLSKLRADRIKTSQGTVYIGKRSISLVGQPHLAGPMVQFLTAVARTNK